MFDYGFEEDKDFTPISGKTISPKGGRPSMDYALTLDCAKEISMLQRSDKGKQARQYFIAMEKQALAPRSTLDILELTIKGLREHQIELDEIKSDIKQLKAATQVRPDVYTAAGFLTVKGVKATLQLCQKTGMAAMKVCKQMGWETTTTPDPRFGKVNVYPIEALERAYNTI